MRLKLETSFKKHEKFNGYTFEARDAISAKAHIRYKLGLTGSQARDYFYKAKLRLVYIKEWVWRIWRIRLLILWRKIQG